MDAEIRTRLIMKKFFSKIQLRTFGILGGILFSTILGLLLPAIKGQKFMYWTLFIGVPGMLFGLLAPGLLYYPFWFLREFLDTIKMLFFYISMTIIYIIILVPIALISKVFGFDPLKIKFHNKKSYRNLKE